jgi:hypothetical protein
MSDRAVRRGGGAGGGEGVATDDCEAEGEESEGTEEEVEAEGEEEEEAEAVVGMKSLPRRAALRRERMPSEAVSAADADVTDRDG